jgi:hypothetical protein
MTLTKLYRMNLNFNWESNTINHSILQTNLKYKICSSDKYTKIFSGNISIDFDFKAKFRYTALSQMIISIDTNRKL